MMQIKMVTDTVLEMEQKLLQLSRDVYEVSDQISSAANQNIWQGPTADEFRQRVFDLRKNLHGLAEDATKLYLAVGHEREQWLQVDEEGMLRLKGICKVPKPPQDPSTDIIIDYGSDLIEDVYYDWRYKNFQKWWSQQTPEERLEYLQNMQNRMADRYGWPRMLVVVDDLVDPKDGDARGVNLGGVMVIDADNVNTDNPWRLIETLMHETRHEYQRDVVSNYQANGSVPDGMTKEQVEKWAYEYSDDHYVQPEDNFSDYYHQAIETDARDYGDRVMDDVLNEMGNSTGGGGAW